MLRKLHLQYQVLLVTQYLLASKYNIGFQRTRKSFYILAQLYHRYQDFRIGITLSMTDEPDIVYSYKLMEDYINGDLSIIIG